jgi:DNA invertase Pin-like site-specific DNA recombinase
MAKVIIYLRVSSSEQMTENQLPALQKWIADKGYELVEVYSENESAWKSGHQRELSRLFADLHNRKVDICLLWALDRLTREGIAKIFELINKFKFYGVRVISYQESWTEQSGPMADLLYAITAWVAEFESKRRSERTLAGLARALREGKKLGRPKGSKDKAKRQRTGYLLRYANPTLKERYTK